MKNKKCTNPIIYQDDLEAISECLGGTIYLDCEEAING